MIKEGVLNSQKYGDVQVYLFSDSLLIGKKEALNKNVKVKLYLFHQELETKKAEERQINVFKKGNKSPLLTLIVKKESEFEEWNTELQKIQTTFLKIEQEEKEKKRKTGFLNFFFLEEN